MALSSYYFLDKLNNAIFLPDGQLPSQ